MNVLALLADPHAWAALITLTLLEIVLGIDNLVFISVLTSRLGVERRRRARQVGLSLAFLFRVIMHFLLKAEIHIHIAVHRCRGEGAIAQRFCAALPHRGQ